MTGRSIREALRKRTGVRPRPAIRGSALEKSLREFGAPEAGAEHHCNSRTVYPAHIDPGILNGQRRSHHSPRREAIQTSRLQARHHIGGAKWLHQKRSPQSVGFPRRDGFGFHRAGRNQSRDRTIRTHRTDPGNRRQIRTHDRPPPNSPSPNPLANMSAELLPPNPAETDMASGSASRRTSPRSHSTLGLSMGSVSRSVGSSAPERTAVIVIAASNA